MSNDFLKFGSLAVTWCRGGGGQLLDEEGLLISKSYFPFLGQICLRCNLDYNELFTSVGLRSTDNVNYQVLPTLSNICSIFPLLLFPSSLLGKLNW
jgi:hypothetical protein